MLVTVTSFSRSHQHFECEILTHKSLYAPYLLNQMMESDQNLCKCITGIIKRID